MLLEHHRVVKRFAVILSDLLVLALLIRDPCLPIWMVPSFLIYDLGLMLSIGFFIYIMESSCIRLAKEVVGASSLSVGLPLDPGVHFLFLFFFDTVQEVLDVLLVFERVTEHVKVRRLPSLEPTKSWRLSILIYKVT